MIHPTLPQRRVIFTLAEHTSLFNQESIIYSSGVKKRTVDVMIQKGMLMPFKTDEDTYYNLIPSLRRWAFRNLSKSPFLK